MEGKICPQCKTINPINNRFCHNCGYSLSNAEVKTSEEDEKKNIKQTKIISTTEEKQNIEQINNNKAELVSQNNNEEKLNNSKTNFIYELPTPQDLAPNVNFKELSPELRERAEL
jgi:ribosomal protein L40E